jgi:peptide/nickel transport system substrate-binding protein
LKKLLLLTAFAMVFVLTACSSGSSENTNEESKTKNNENVSNGEPQYGGELTIVDLSDGQSLDPHVVTDAASMRYIENMYNTLLRYKNGTYGELEGDLVNEYTISEDGKKYTFQLHEGVLFHNGDELTSEDVKYSIERIVENEVRGAQFSAVQSIETPEDYKVVITLKEPVAPFLTFLANPVNAIVNKAIVEENDGSLDNVDAGSGPFMLVEWKKDQALTLEKNENYFKEGKPYLDKVVWRSIPDETSRTTALRNKEIDIVLQVSPKDIPILEKADGIKVESVTGTYWEYLGLNTSSGPLADKKVRQAIAWAIDREALNTVIKFGQATVLKNGPIPPGHWAQSEDEIYPKRDLDKAEALLKEAGYENGFSVTLKVSPNQPQVDAAQVIKQQLKEVGIEVEVLSQEKSVFFEALGKKDFEMTVVGWVGFVDPDEFLYNIFHTDGLYNQQSYSNEKVDELLEKGRKTIDQNERIKIYNEAQTLIAEDAPMVFLYANPQTSAMVEGVNGFDVNPTVSTTSLEDTWLAK